MSKYVFVYCTISSRDEAADLGEMVVKEKLAACVNIFQPHTSIYEWEGKIQHEDEVAIVFKTLESKYKALEKRVIEEHPYDTPCFIALEINEGHKPFLSWVDAQVAVD